MATIRILIADDEAPARARIRRVLGTRPDCTIIAECSNGADTLDALINQEIDVLFLDIQMPELTGFEVIANLPSDHPRPAIIFTTAYDQHAIEAFSVCAVDYLLKPWKDDRLLAALDRAISIEPRKNPATDIESLLQRVQHHANERIAVRDGEHLHFLRVRHIQHVEAAANYVILHCRDARHIHRETLAAMEKRLLSHGFFRANRSNLINLAQVREVKSSAKGPSQIILEGDAVISLTRPIRELEQALSTL
ncbi:LytR/AlgR family response regulator transcription factor [Haloferula sp.]|uniref:LytR/AlgR family response regulator transcription factor n=1 Tax=Haloferula sp. TaxID=2497595 RepID=UPI003C77D43A